MKNDPVGNLKRLGVAWLWNLEVYPIGKRRLLEIHQIQIRVREEY